MRRVTIIGSSYDSYISSQLKEKGIISEFYTANNSNVLNSKNQLILFDVRGLNSIYDIRTAIKALDASALILIIIDREQLQHYEIPLLIAQHAWDYHTAPVQIEGLSLLIGHAMGIVRIRQEYSTDEQKPHQDLEEQSVMHSHAMRDLSKQVSRAAPTNIPILIRGESGTGKELLARYIHRQSHRADKPFITVNCGSLSSGVVQSELFGHEKGAFTGAVHAHKGKIAQADGGTLFLDEIGDLPLEQQVNLLRFLQEGTFDAVGASTTSTSDVRILAATHVNLEEAIEQGNFRLDLFYRLNGLTTIMPPLRDRKDDIIELAESFYTKYAREYNVESCKLSHGAKHALLNHRWKGNVRELINRIRRAVLLCEDGVIQASDLELEEVIAQPHFAQGLKTIKNEVEKSTLISAIAKHCGKMDVIAGNLKISRATLYRLIDKHGIDATG